MSSTVYTRQQSAKQLKCSVRTVDRMIARGELKAYKIGKAGRSIRIKQQDLEKCLKPIKAYSYEAGGLV